jgi:hypothetical protein
MTHGFGETTIRELQFGLTGSIVPPNDPNYESVRRVWNNTVRT